jgi:DNA-binding NarL/FixJ family response regulator
MQSVKILSIEDNPIDSAYIQGLLRESFGPTLELISLDSLKRAGDQLKNDSFDIVLTDLNLPDSEGLDTFFNILSSAPNTAIVILTGTGEEESLGIEAVKKGAEDYIQKKDLNSKTLMRSLQYAIERKRMQLSLHQSIEEKENLITDLKEALQTIKKLNGLLPICSGCKKIRNDNGYWQQVEVYIREHSLAEVDYGTCPECSQNRTLPPQRYVVEKKIADGGMGETYRAWDNELKRHVALKRVGNKRAKAPQTIRLIREAIRLARVQQPNIVNIFDFGRDEHGPFLIMEFLEGETLEKSVLSSALWLQQELSLLAHQSLDALIAAHQLNLLHLDLNPSNIMLVRGPLNSFHVKILDFGLSDFKKLETPEIKTKTETYGTPLYAAPEIFERKPVDARTDLYALGCILYFTAGKGDAFSASTIQEIAVRHVSHETIPLWERRPDLNKAFCAWVMRLIEASPADRFVSALAAKTALLTLEKINNAPRLQLTSPSNSQIDATASKTERIDFRKAKMKKR